MEHSMNKQQKLEELRQSKIDLCREKGLKAVRYGNAWHVSGPGVNFVSSDIAYIQPGDLRPHFQAVR
ncbi:MAG: hypothetical protein RIR18_1917 [Pseudomonadota bacterium]|jgi:hypothetical protein